MKKELIKKKRYLSQEKIEHALRERVKELTCLYSISSELESRKTQKSIFQNITRHIVEGMQFPEICAAKIHLDQETFASRDLSKSPIKKRLGADIHVSGQTRGKVEACYLADAEFLEEEERMMREIGRRISHFLERYELQKELKNYLSNLKTAIRAKTRELEQSEKRYQDLFENAPDGIVISSLKGDVVKANRAFYRMLQYPEDGSVKLNLVRNRMYQNIQKIRPYIFRNLRKFGHFEGVEMTLIDSRGNPCPAIGSFIFIDIDGKRFVEGVYKDIRQRKELEKKLIEQNENLERIVRSRTEDLENQRNLLLRKNQELLTLTEKLKESSDELQTLFNAITDVVVMIDSDFNVKMSNQKGIKDEAKCFQVVFGRSEPCENCPSVFVFKEKRSLTKEMKNEEDYFLLQSYPIFHARGEVDGVLEFSRLITKQKNMEIQLIQTDKLAALGQLISGVAHEINNPNTFLRGNILIIQEALHDILPILDRHCIDHPDLKIARLNYDAFRKNVPTLVEDMVQGTNRIKNIVGGLRKFAKRDDGILNDDIQINAVVESCLRLVANQISRKAQVKRRLGENIPAFRGNAQRLEQVLVNILINASQAIEKEKGLITISTAFLEKEGLVEVAISDNGIGMDEITQKQIFDPFFTTKRNSGGTGLGLSVAYGIIKEHRGQVKVESKLGMGTTFYLYLPVTAEAKR